MGRVDHGCDPLVLQEACEPGFAAEAADPGRDRGRPRVLGASGEGQERVEMRTGRKTLRERRGFGRAAENEDAHDRLVPET